MKKRYRFKRGLAILLALLLCLNPLTVFAEDIMEETTTTTEDPAPTESPTTTETPATTEAPKTPETPTTTEVPTVAETPAITETLKTPETSATTEAPAVTETPATTETPKSPESPATTENPEIPETPATTETPAITEISITSEISKVTDTTEASAAMVVADTQGTGSVLACGKEEHKHTGTGCGGASVCGKEEHTHTADCYETSTTEKPDGGDEKPEDPKTPAIPAGATCIFCKMQGFHTEGCYFTNNPDKIGMQCVECYSKLPGHKNTCSQHPDNVKKRPPEESSFELTVGGGEAQKVEINETLTKENLKENIPATKTENGVTYVLDRVQSVNSGANDWTWYMAGIMKDGDDAFTVDYFYNNVWREDRDFYAHIGSGNIKVEYAVDANGDGIADKYQASIRYALGGGTEKEVFYKDLGPANMIGISVPGNSFSRCYATELPSNLSRMLDGHRPENLDGQEFTGWTVKADDKEVCSIEQTIDEGGNTLLTVKWQDGSEPTVISSKDYVEGTDLLSLVPFTIKGSRTYTFAAQFKSISEPEPTPATSPEPTGTPGATPEPTPGTSPEPTGTPGTTPEPTPGTSPEPTGMPGTTPEPTQAPGTSPEPTATPEIAPASVDGPVPPADDSTIPNPPAGPITAPIAAAPAVAQAAALQTVSNEAETAQTSEMVQIDDTEVPLAGQEEGEETSLLQLEDEEVPLASMGTWALLNLLLAVLTVLISAVLLIGCFFGRKENDKKETEGFESDEEQEEFKKKTSLRIMSMIPALVSVLLFIWTENMHNPMVFVDKWTLWMAVIAVMNVTLAFFSKKSKKDDKEKPSYKMV